MPAKKPAKSVAKKAVEPVKSVVKNTPVPKVSKKPVAITHEMIAKRAYEIHVGGTGGSEQDNWHRAERELRAGL